MNPVGFVHSHCRNSIYLRSNIQRTPVPYDLVRWNVAFDDYKPVFHEAERLKVAPWADPKIDTENSSFTPHWYTIDSGVNRTSNHGKYTIQNGVPLNVCGRTGMIGRGLLGRYGPNHTVDPIVTRWKRDANGSVARHTVSGKDILEVVAIQRRDNNHWAFPGGIVDRGETVSNTLEREFIEEALNSQPDSAAKINDFFNKHGTEVYRGYIDDPRNTDNAWTETTAFNFHDDSISTGPVVIGLRLEAGDDAKNVRWQDIGHDMELHPNHRMILKNVALLRNSHW